MLCYVLKEWRRMHICTRDDNSIRNNISTQSIVFFRNSILLLPVLSSYTYIGYILYISIYNTHEQQWMYNNNIFVRHRSFVDRNRRTEIFLSVCLCENKEPTRFFPYSFLALCYRCGIGAILNFYCRNPLAIPIHSRCFFARNIRNIL